jgi:aspartyl-tRNA(Asn)/glutamyl-tRNA(Gln) amidotransferase subunit A
MSLLRQAEQCILNQKTHASLNAFISPFFKQKDRRWLDRLKQAEERKQNGVPTTNETLLQTLTLSS